MGMKCLQVNIQKQTGTPRGLSTQHVSGMQLRLHECVKQLEAPCFSFSVLVTRGYLF